MRFKKRFLLVMMVIILTTGITAYAANCPACERANVETVCTTQGEHLWHNSYQHTKEYSVDGDLKSEICTVSCSEEKIYWICPKGHGVTSTMIHHQELHSSEHCTDLNYYY